MGMIAFTVICARELLRPGTSERSDARLRRGIVALTDAAALAGGRTDEDDAPAFTLLAHPCRCRARTRERPSEVRPDDHVEVVVGHLPQHLVPQHAGVRDHYVEAAEVRHRARDQ